MMPILSVAQNTQPDYVALAMFFVLIVVVAIMVIRKRFFTQKPTITPPPRKEVEKPVAPGSAGQIKLHGVPPKTAAMLMAIVADKMGKPLNELRFISIKEVE